MCCSVGLATGFAPTPYVVSAQEPYTIGLPLGQGQDDVRTRRQSQPCVHSHNPVCTVTTPVSVAASALLSIFPSLSQTRHHYSHTDCNMHGYIVRMKLGLGFGCNTIEHDLFCLQGLCEKNDALYSSEIHNFCKAKDYVNFEDRNKKIQLCKSIWSFNKSNHD